MVSAERPLVVAVSAPAGYGKSTLMAEWARRDRRKVAWVSLDRTDNDAVALMRLLATALGGVNSVDPAVFDDLASPGVSILGRVVPRLAVSMQSPAPLLLLLDDLHELYEQESRDALTLLLDRVPAGSTVAAASRGEVFLNLARRRVRGELLEIGVPELAFNIEEAAQLLHSAGVGLASEAVVELHRRTEGWPAGLYLGALALRDAPGAVRTLDVFAGDDRFVADFLRSEVLDRTPPHHRAFLTRTAVLDQLSGSLCDQMLGTTGSAELLASLERTNLFLLPLDRRREWYRYHGLFRDMLRAELARIDSDVMPELHRRAADWYEEHRRLDTAIDHALASGDRDRAAVLVGRSIFPAYLSGRGGSPGRWLSRFSEAEIERYPWMAVLAAWVCALTGRPIEATRWADTAERGSFVGAPPDGSASIDSARAMLRSGMCSNGVAAMVVDAELAESQERPGSLWRSTALYHLFWARYLSGDHEAAEATLEDLIALLEGVDHPNHVLGLTHRGLLAIERGGWNAAAADLEQARTQLTALRLNEYGASAITFAASARVALHEHDMRAASSYLAHAMRLRPQFTWAVAPGAVQLRLELAKTLLALADPAGARSMLREIDEILRHRPDLGILLLQVDSLRQQLATLPAGTVGVSTLSPAELRLLPYLQTQLTHEQIGQRLYVSLNTVRTQTQSIYRKLGVSSRTGAVEQARRAGLLAG